MKDLARKIKKAQARLMMQHWQVEHVLNPQSEDWGEALIQDYNTIKITFGRPFISETTEEIIWSVIYHELLHGLADRLLNDIRPFLPDKKHKKMLDRKEEELVEHLARVLAKGEKDE